MNAAQPDSHKQKRRRRLLTLMLVIAVLWLLLAFIVPALSSGTAQSEASGSERHSTNETAHTQSEEGAAPALSGSATTADNAVSDEASGAYSSQLPLPQCEYSSVPAPMAGYDQWQFTLLDTTYRLPADYVPPGLVSLRIALQSVDPTGTTALEGHQLRDFAAAELVSLFAAAEAAGVQLAVQSAYRSYSYQQSTFDYWVRQDGSEAALRTSARAGHSEHQLGTAVDLRSRHGPAAWDLDDWANTPEGAWTQANAHLFGFVMSYPKGSEHVSCYAYEPWHYRYVGRDLAAQVYESGLSPREYLWQLLHSTDQAGAQSDEEIADE